MRIVCVHGIGNQLAGEHMLLAQWLPALRDGLVRAGHDGSLGDGDVGMAFYGDIFRPTGSRLGPGDPMYRAEDVQPGFETELLLAWWAEAARVDGRVVDPGADTLARTPGSVQAALRALSRSRFWAEVALRAMISDLKQVRGYLTDPAIRATVRARVCERIDSETQVVVAHSLGSVVAYEALHELRLRGGHQVRAFVTLGSPLGIPNLIFDRLQPAPTDGRGSWPGDTGLAWTNVADAGDVVALVKDLRPRFGDVVRSVLVDNGAHAHSVLPYLTDAKTGAAVATALG